MKDDVTTKRPYRQSARARAAKATGERILDVFSARLSGSWFDEIKLEDVALEAGVAVQTVIRRFGGKEGLLDAAHDRLNWQVGQRREVPAGDAAGVVAALAKDYEAAGELVLRTLAQEERYAPIKAMTDVGRKMHREWMSIAFKPWLDPLSEADRRKAVDALVVAGDIYVWKLIRKDMQRQIADYRALVQRMCAAAVGLPQEELFNNAMSGEAL
jgi:AcrR family transcriptional regulator